VVLARCSASENGPAPDQTSYEPQFQSASAIMTNYRNLLKAGRTVPEELARVGTAAGAKARASKAGSKKSATEKQ
jgi:hypothetical protein